ncbi:DNA polymerase II [Aestuariicella hydrocarbonica]|uniref:DNA polymerase n=2 Tax=Pseudomaricurvus hydrocarbonicus TaxID=1470433 RepID=A0A9E5MPD6_9GAMM|nr:DNA polymerase II [Aestuariicella hydrocarbonica]
MQGFILTRQWDDAPLASRFGRLRQLQLEYWVTSDTGAIKLIFEQQTGVFFLPHEQLDEAEALLNRRLGQSARHPSVAPVWEAKPLNLLSFEFQPVVGLYFREQRTLYRARDILIKQGLTPFESDIQPTDRFLMERFITGSVTVTGTPEREGGVAVMRNPQVSAASLLSAEGASAEYQPHYTVMSLDIETSMTGGHLYSVGAVVTNTRDELAQPQEIVLMIGAGDVPDTQPYLQYCDDEKQLLRCFLQWFDRIDPDILIGWNVINFDLRFLQQKADELGMRLNLGRGQKRIDWRQSRSDDEHYTLVVPGRLVMDGIDTLKSATYNFESFALDSVAQEFLQRGKLTDDVDHRGETITQQFHHDKPALAAYNLEDCQLVWDIFVKAQLIEFAVERARLTGLAMDRFGGSVAAFDNRYLPRLHRQGFVAPMLIENPVGVGSPGGYVMDSIPGMYEHVLVLDFKSLYPSIIRTFMIDPLARVAGRHFEETEQGIHRDPHWDREETGEVDVSALVPGFNGAVFLKHRALLPNIIGELWDARDRAKRQQNSAMSQAIKIIMNSFYGVLGTPGCRFFDYRLPSSITLRGHQVLTQSRELIEAQGHRVIYGDTDSVFVCLNADAGTALDDIDQQGRALADYLNDWWRNFLQEKYQVQSHLEIEFETHYSRFVMPTIRGAETGSKKRYAGLVEKPGKTAELVFKGLEAVRTDWTQLAREFQRELYRRVFMGESYDDYVMSVVDSIRNGEQDAKLVYRKRIRRHLDEYVRNVPPHVQAARLADQWLQEQDAPQRYQRGGWIRYVLTPSGPEPLEHVTTTLDYELYLERQIAPVADGILQFVGTTFEQIVDQQLGLF